MSYSGETIQLERHLNDFFDPVSRRIKIRHFADNVEFDYLLSENGTLEDYDYLISEATDSGFIYLIGENVDPLDVDFLVLFPTVLGNPVSEIRSHVEKYRLAGRRYSIQFI